MARVNAGKEQALSEAVQASRRARAIIVVAAVVASLAIVLLMPEAVRASGSGSSYVSRIWDEMKNGAQIESALEEVGMLRLTPDNAPCWLESELLGLDYMKNAIADLDFRLVWFLREGSRDDVLCEMEKMLAVQGWSANAASVEGDDDPEMVRSYVKRKGELRWLMVECAQAGEDAAVVLHIERA